MSLPIKTSLPVHDPRSLLTALLGEVDPAQLLCVDHVKFDGQSFRSVHSHVLSGFMVEEDYKQAQVLAACCERLIELRAPITDAYGDGAVSQFCPYPWPAAPDRARQVGLLADVYVRAGLWGLEASAPGQVLTRADRAALADHNQDGLVPLAIAIFTSDAPLARYLLERDVSLELGVVYAGEPAVSAIDLAREMGAGEIHACIVESLLRQRLAEVPPQELSVGSPRKARRACL